MPTQSKSPFPCKLFKAWKSHYMSKGMSEMRAFEFSRKKALRGKQIPD